CTWNNRNRWAEDQTWLAWDDPEVPPEEGQTTEIIFMNGGAEYHRITGLTGNSHEFHIVETTKRLEELTLKFVSRRNGLESLQGMKIDLLLYMKGFGSDWGYLWGGWPTTDVLTDIESDLEGYLPTVEGSFEEND